MKKKFLFSFVAVLAVGYYACRKSDSVELPKSRDPFVNESVAFLSKQISSADLASLDLDRYMIFNDDKNAPRAVKIPLKDNSQKFVVVGKGKAGLIGNWVDISKLDASSFQQGELITKSFDGNRESVVSIANNKVEKISSVINGKKRITTISYDGGMQVIKRQRVQAVSISEGDEDWQWLPDVTVTGYKSYTTISYWSLYWYFNQNPSYIYTYTEINPYGSGGGGGTSGSTVNVPPAEYNSGPGIDINKFMNCFNQVSDAGATYTLTMHADLPVNSNPDALVNGVTPGHVFLTFTKSNGGTTVTQVIGFYPQNGPLSIFNTPVNSKIVNDGGHEYNASITMNNVSQIDFNAAKNLATSYANSLKYDLNDFNCGNYALNVFNMVRPGSTDITVSDDIRGGINFGTTPNNVYKKLQEMQNQGGDAGSITVGTQNAGASHGPCN